MIQARFRLFIPLIAATLLTGVSNPAHAHAELISSNPTNNASLTELPETLSLTFGENLLVIEGESVNTVSLQDPQGLQLNLTPVEIKAGTISVNLVDNQALPYGKYKLSYRVVSEDGHPVSGEITFELKTPSSVTVATPSATYKSESTNASQVNKSGNSLTLIAIVTGIFVGLGILLFVRYRSRKKSEN